MAGRSSIRWLVALSWRRSALCAQTHTGPGQRSWSGWTGWSRRIARSPNRCATLRGAAWERPPPPRSSPRVEETARYPGAADRRAGADQSRGLAEVSHPAHRDGAVQRLHQLEAERRRRTIRWWPRPPARDTTAPPCGRPSSAWNSAGRRPSGAARCTAPSTWISSPAPPTPRCACAPPTSKSTGKTAASWPGWRSRSSIRASRVRWRRWASRR